MSTNYTIDRFEGGTAVLHDFDTGETQLCVPRDQLPPEAAEGDVILQDGSALTIDPIKTQEARDAAQALLDKLTHGR